MAKSALLSHPFIKLMDKNLIRDGLSIQTYLFKNTIFFTDIRYCGDGSVGNVLVT